MSQILSPANAATQHPAPGSGRKLFREPWPHLLIIAILMISRRPAAILHPQFWAEDGQVFYHDAYTIGLASLWHPLGGYLNTLSRLVALFTVNFPLTWAPGIYAAIAFIIQLSPPVMMLSARMDQALPSWPARLAMVYFYAALPDSHELNINLTNAQWHLTMLAFLLLVGTPAATRAGRLADVCLLALSGVSGPFGIFLTPLAWLEYWQTRQRATLTNALVVSFAAAVQLAFILASHATSGRLATPLDASLPAFIKIVTYQIIFSGLLGSLLTVIFLTLPIWHSMVWPIAAMLAASILVAVALWIGPGIYRKAAFWAAALFAAALITPVSSASIPQWTAMTHPGNGIRYYAIPSLVWFATILIIARSPWLAARLISYILIMAAVIGIRFSWTFPPLKNTHFNTEAKQFAAAAPGSVMSFDEHPLHWSMTLTKK